MGHHLHLYASHNVTLGEVSRWCHARAHELIAEVPIADQPSVNKVQQEMSRLQRIDSSFFPPGGHNPDHLEHWSNWCGVVIWDFLVWQPFVCNAQVVELAIEYARVAMRTHEGIRKMYPCRDFTQDEVVGFLCEHQGAVVWGDNDGV